MLKIQEYLRSGNSLDDLIKDHGIYHTITNGKISLNYDQIEASNTDPLACECRGLILEEGTYNVIACPFFRFFNYEQEGVAAKIDWPSARYLSKIDGTCIICANYKGNWFVGTRSRPEADVPLTDDPTLTFSKLANLACENMWNSIHKTSDKKTIQDLMDKFDKNKTYVFELTSPLNRIVCKYNDIRLTLLGVRDNITLIEDDPDNWVGLGKEFGLTIPDKFYFKSISEMVDTIRGWNAEEKEGVVVVDKFWNRVKVKNPQYVAFNHMRDSLSTSYKGVIELILLGNEDDVLGMMPEFIVARILRLKPLVKEVLTTAQKDWEELSPISDMKEFALEAQKRLWPAVLFALKRGKTKSIRDFSLGNKDVTKIPSPAVENMLAMCKKIDPNCVDL